MVFNYRSGDPNKPGYSVLQVASSFHKIILLSDRYNFQHDRCECVARSRGYLRLCSMEHTATAEANPRVSLLPDLCCPLIGRISRYLAVEFVSGTDRTLENSAWAPRIVRRKHTNKLYSAACVPPKIPIAGPNPAVAAQLELLGLGDILGSNDKLIVVYNIEIPQAVAITNG